MKENILLIGAGGHCRACMDVIEREGRYAIAGVVQRSGGGSLSGFGEYAVLGTDDDLPDLRKKFSHALVAVGQIASPDTRIRLFGLLKRLAFELPTVVSPYAYVSASARLGEGSIVMHQALVNAGAVVGVNCIVNTKALLEHDAVVGDHCHIATGAILNGGVRIGAGAFVGSGCVVRENVNVAESSVLPMGSAVRFPPGGIKERP